MSADPALHERGVAAQDAAVAARFLGAHVAEGLGVRVAVEVVARGVVAVEGDHQPATGRRPCAAPPRPARRSGRARCASSASARRAGSSSGEPAGAAAPRGRRSSAGSRSRGDTARAAISGSRSRGKTASAARSGSPQQQVEVGGHHEAADRLRRVRPPHAHDARGDAERVEDVPQGPRLPRRGGDGRREARPSALEHADQHVASRQERPVAVRAAEAVGRGAPYAVVAREAARHHRRPQRAPPRSAAASRAGRRPPAGRVARRRAPGRSRDPAPRRRATGRRCRRRITRRVGRLASSRTCTRRDGGHGLRPQGQRHRERDRRGEDGERGGQGALVAGEAGEVEADGQEHGGRAR